MILKHSACADAPYPHVSPEDPLTSGSRISERDSRSLVAVGTTDGNLVDEHIGEVWAFQIWKPTADGYLHLDDRIVPVSEAGYGRWNGLVSALKDCRAVLVSDIGELPAEILTRNSIDVIEMNGFVTMGLDAVFLGQEVALLKGRRKNCSRGGTCSGNGDGCGRNTRLKERAQGFAARAS
jgi:nitrogen fixation protein NifB